MQPSPSYSRFAFLAAFGVVAVVGLFVSFLMHQDIQHQETRRIRTGSTMGEAIPISLNGGNNVKFTGSDSVNCPVNIKAATGNGYTYVIMDLDFTGRSNYSPPGGPKGCSSYDGANPWPCKLNQSASGTGTVPFVLTLAPGGTPSNFVINSWDVKDYQNDSDPDQSVKAVSVPATPVPVGIP